MRWPEVTVIFAFVAGAVVAGISNKENLSMVLAGAGAGFATQTARPKEEQLLRKRPKTIGGGPEPT